jgi:hypothetical protein
MGYDLHITRKEFWPEDKPISLDISLDEWLKYIDNDPELELSGIGSSNSPSPLAAVFSSDFGSITFS